ncbi:aldo/keto reductase [Latilactobacillus graminis]|uniref:Aldo keto reductase family protein n=2 Tax=Latilactobacillus graminis TaxID=60519 RepID=A0AA89I3X4_9LACO|nr:aldo/keto reductase [Latilactobacillus graminis]KRM24267.1 aldo keto reductase family protein [Latilactobacillus graminis DSM 20719]QFP78755.1 aldo/keto reductase [Latilactobacillus graminis]
MSNLTTSYTLTNGVQIPKLGFGTWQTPDGQTAVAAVKEALKAGYRHIDTAQAYGNEGSVGEAIQASKIDRSDLFITTKIWNSNHTYNLTISSFEESLKKLQTDYVDLLLIHWPNPIDYRDNWEQANAETWRAMEALYKTGKARAIGVSNFRVHHLEALKKTATVQPMVNQLFLAPGELEPTTVKYSRDHGMLLEAYSPLGTGKIFSVPEMQTLADKYQRSIPQIALRWSLQHAFLPLPKSVHAEYIQQNTQVFDFELTAEDMALIDQLDGVVGHAQDPDQTTF